MRIPVKVPAKAQVKEAALAKVVRQKVAQLKAAPAVKAEAPVVKAAQPKAAAPVAKAVQDQAAVRAAPVQAPAQLPMSAAAAQIQIPNLKQKPTLDTAFSFRERSNLICTLPRV